MVKFVTKACDSILNLETFESLRSSLVYFILALAVAWAVPSVPAIILGFEYERSFHIQLWAGHVLSDGLLLPTVCLWSIPVVLGIVICVLPLIRLCKCKPSSTRRTVVNTHMFRKFFVLLGRNDVTPGLL